MAEHFFLPCICSSKQTEAIERGTSLPTKRDQHLLSAREWHCHLIEVRSCTSSKHEPHLLGKTSTETQSVKLHWSDMFTISTLVNADFQKEILPRRSITLVSSFSSLSGQPHSAHNEAVNSKWFNLIFHRSRQEAWTFPTLT